MVQLVGASSHAPKGCRFDSRSKHIPKWRVLSLVGACIGRNLWVSLSHRCFFLSLSLKISEHVLRWGLNKKKSKLVLGAKKNKKEGAGEGPVLHEDPPLDQKTSPSSQTGTLKIRSWNVDGLRDRIKKQGLDRIKEETPDILCLQELQELPGLSHQYWPTPSDKEGCSGVGLIFRQCPLKVSHGTG